EHGDEGLRRYANQAKGLRVSRVPDEIFQVPADIFVPAGRTGVLAMADELHHRRRTENADVRDVAKFFAATGVRLIAEGANHPLSESAERWLESEGVRILPDFIVNCGGLIGCWVEWEARHRGAVEPVVDLSRVGADALERIRRTVADNVRELLATTVPAREAAKQIAKHNREKLLTSARWIRVLDGWDDDARA